MAIRNQSVSTVREFKQADAFLNLSITTKDGSVHHLKTSERLFEDKLLGRSLINAATNDPNLVINVQGTVHICNDVEDMKDLSF